MTPRQRLVRYLVQITEHTTVEDQLRQQWLRELDNLNLIKSYQKNGLANSIQQKKQTKEVAP